MEAELTPLQSKLLKIQAELKAPKNRLNKFGNYNYRDAEGILEAVKPLLVREGILLVMSDEIETQNGRNYVTSTIQLQLGESAITVNGSAREEETKKGMDGSQITGASSSYARKYALNGLFLIDDTKDSDSTNDGSGDSKTATKTTATKTVTKTTVAESNPAALTGSEKPKNEVIKGSNAYNQSVEWIAKTDLMTIEALEKIKKKYSISEEVEKSMLEDVAKLKGDKK